MAKLAEFLDIARSAASAAGKVLRDRLDGKHQVGFKGDGHHNPFSQADKEAEGVVLDILSRAFPEHRIISEESGQSGSPSEYTWFVDPLDGTVNFIHGFRYFGVSLALSYRGDVILGVIYNPVLDEMFTAVKGGGAYLNGKKMQVSTTARMDECLLGMSFPYDRASVEFSTSIDYFTRLVKSGQAMRRNGSTALSLCNVACGRYDGFCVVGNEVWDYAAGILLVREAGGMVTDFTGAPFRIHGERNEVLATNGKIHRLILDCFHG